MVNSFSDRLNRDSSADGKNYLLLFIIWPFLALIAAITNYDQKVARRVVYLYLIYFGLIIVADNWMLDSYRYAIALKTVAPIPISEFSESLGGLNSENGSLDIYGDLLTFLVSRFTIHFGILFAIFAAVFGYFYLKSVNILYTLYRENPGWNALIHMVFFIIIIPITALNGVRMWTAAWIFFYGAIQVIIYRDKRFLLVALGSIFVHWSFLTANVLLIAYFFLGNRNLIYLPLAIVSFILPQLFLPYYSIISLAMGGSIQNRFEGYSSTGYGQEIQALHEQASWFVFLGNDLVFYYLIFALIIIHFGLRYRKKDKADDNLFSFSLLFLAFVNFGSPIPSLGTRFQVVFFLFATFYLFRYFVKLPGNRINILSWIGLFPMLLYAAVTFRIGSEIINTWLLSPVLGLPLLVPGLSMAKLLF